MKDHTIYTFLIINSGGESTLMRKGQGMGFAHFGITLIATMATNANIYMRMLPIADFRILVTGGTADSIMSPLLLLF